MVLYVISDVSMVSTFYRRVKQVMANVRRAARTRNPHRNVRRAAL
jgi:hypothetical protein